MYEQCEGNLNQVIDPLLKIASLKVVIALCFSLFQSFVLASDKK